MQKWCVTGLVLWVGLSWVGCTRRPAIAPSVTKSVTLRRVDPAKFDAVVQKYRGKVLLVDYWATWCQPCKELFPHTVALSRRFAGQGLAVVSVSLDDPEDEAQALEFLTDHGATFENLRADTGASAESTAALGIANGAIPFLKLYDRNGRLRETFPAPIKPATVDDAVKQLLAEQASAT
jgi:thiol-disulfide isomerase/thioredoxin